MLVHSHKTKQINYPSIDLCIYCLKKSKELSAKGIKLTDEHIIPFSLNGEYIFLNASCEKCSKIINDSFEQRNLKTTLLTIRNILGLKRRKKKEPPLTYPIAANEGANINDVYDLYLPPKEFPPLFPMPHFPKAGLLSGTEYGEGIPQFRFQMVELQSFKAWAMKHGINKVGVRLPIAPYEVSAFLAKIAYSFAVAELGIDAFDGNQIRDVILGERKDINNFTGEPILKRSNLTKRYLHNLYIKKEGEYCTVLVHLFAPYGISPYQVVVGKYL